MRDWLKRLIINIICFAIGVTIGTLIVPKPIVNNGISDYIDSLNTDSIYRDSIYIVNDSIVERII
jgi:hypothetical protein